MYTETAGERAIRKQQEYKSAFLKKDNYNFERRKHRFRNR